MKTCPNTKCNKQHTKNGIYCSVACSNKTRTRTPESIEKTRQSLKTWYNTLSKFEKEQYHLNLSLKSHSVNANEKRLDSYEKKKIEKIASTPWIELSWEIKREMICNDQGGVCVSCQLDSWLSCPIILEIDHIDGDNTNNQRNNLRGLCPNCHSLTETWRGRNKTVRPTKISDEQLRQAIKTSGNIRQGLLSLGLAAKGGNYKRAKRVMVSPGRIELP